jgi:hypothetical protein
MTFPTQTERSQSLHGDGFRPLLSLWHLRSLFVWGCRPLLALLLCTPSMVYTEESHAPLTNQAIIKLVRAGFREKTVIAIIRRRPSRFNLSADRLVELKKSGVSEKIILSMLAREDDWTDFYNSGWGEDTFLNDKDVSIFGSGSGNRSQGSSTTGNTGNTNVARSTGSASARILRTPSNEPPKLERTPTLTNQTVVDLVKAGFSEGTIIRRIQDSPVQFDLTSQALTELQKNGVTDGVIKAMTQAMSGSL